MFSTIDKHYSGDSETRHDIDLATRIIHRIFSHYPTSMAIVLWDGRVIRIGHQEPSFALTLKHPHVLRDLVLYRDPVRLAEAYFDGDIDVTGDFNAAMKLRYYVESLQPSWHDRVALMMDVLMLNDANGSKQRKRDMPSRQNDRNSIAFHYDVSNDFYRLWLDKNMVYSCAYFDGAYAGFDSAYAGAGASQVSTKKAGFSKSMLPKSSTEGHGLHPTGAAISLDAAQTAKLDHICRKLRLHEGDKLLDIGCGWGALACWAAKNYGAQVHGITLSRKQYEYACDRVQNEGLQHLVTIELLDYRELPASASYDKVVSVGMFEHVGLKNLPLYFSTVHRVLKPGGLFLNHGITTGKTGWSKGVSSRFINRHVFPDGELDSVSNIQGGMEAAHFEIMDVESLRPHYALTLREWVRRLESNAAEAIAYVGERTFRVWRLYMTGCALQFEEGATSIYQILAIRKDGGLPQLPLTRRDLYSEAASVSRGSVKPS